MCRETDGFSRGPEPLMPAGTAGLWVISPAWSHSFGWGDHEQNLSSDFFRSPEGIWYHIKHWRSPPAHCIRFGTYLARGRPSLPRTSAKTRTGSNWSSALNRVLTRGASRQVILRKGVQPLLSVRRHRTRVAPRATYVRIISTRQTFVHRS